MFWAKGYDAATVDDLVAGMGINRPSLYNVFGDKATLFMRCLQTYAEQLGALAAVALAAPNIADAVRGFFELSVEHATRAKTLGCLLVCVAPMVDDAKVRSYVVRISEAATRSIEARLRASDLPRKFPFAERAQQIVDLSAGLTVRARSGASRKLLLRDAAAAAALVLK